jgi:hypothetical protein
MYCLLPPGVELTHTTFIADTIRILACLEPKEIHDQVFVYHIQRPMVTTTQDLGFVPSQS